MYKSLVKKAKTSPTEKNLAAAFSSIDKAAKHHVIHANKAARLKSSLTHSPEGAKEQKSEKKTEKPTTKKAVKKTTKKSTKKASSK